MLRDDAGHRHRADGHHDAGDGRLRDDARDPQDGAVPRPADHRPHGQGDEGRPREDASRPGPRTTSPSRSTRTSCSRPARLALAVSCDGGRGPSPDPRGRRHAGEPARALGGPRGPGLEVQTASSGREALRLLLQNEFAVILLDVNMPAMDGFETAALIRQRPSSEHTPIIFLTAYPRRHARRPRLFARRGRLHPGAAGARRPAGEGRRLRRALPQDGPDEGAGGRARAKGHSAPAPHGGLAGDQFGAVAEQTLQVVAAFARDIVGAHQASPSRRPI